MISCNISVRTCLWAILIFASSFGFLNAQYIISGNKRIEYKNDSVILSVENVRGSIQWEVSGDKTVWYSLTGETGNSLKLHVDSSAYYRTRITEGTCQPVFSDTALIAELFDLRDGQVYNILKIGELWWMQNNLNYDFPGSWYYNDDSLNYASVYGRLYNWEMAAQGCPQNWHLPGDLEWKLLETNLGMSMIQADSAGWRGEDQGTLLQLKGNDDFNALRAGFRLADGTYGFLESSGTFWTSTGYDNNNAWYRGIGAEKNIHRYFFDRNLGFSVRCVRNSPPIVYTDTVRALSTYTSIATSTIILDGGAPVTSRGFCWSTAPDPEITDKSIAITGGIGSFSGNITGLTKNTEYYVRAYAINSHGINYGNTLMFRTPQVSFPTVITKQVGSISMNSAIIGGSIPDDGGLPVTSRGLCWDTIPVPEMSGHVILKGTGTGDFSETISSLKINHKYYVKAFAVNSIDTAFGAEIVFETLPVNPVDTIIDTRDGISYEIVKIGYQWWFVDNLNYYMQEGSWYYNNDSTAYAADFGRLYNWDAANKACPSGWHLPRDSEWKILESEIGMTTTETNNTGWRGTDQGDQLKPGALIGFDVLFGGFKDDHDIFSYINSSGTFWSATSYSPDNAWYRGFGPEPNIHRENFNKTMAFSVRCVRDNTPIIQAQLLADSTTRNSAVVSATIVYDGGDIISAKGLCWGNSANPDLSGNKISAGSGNASFTAKITGLTANTTYYVRAYAINKFDTAYSDNMEFIAVSKPVINTSDVVNITISSATTGGTITDDGGAPVLSRGVCWSLLPEPLISNSKTINGSGTGSYTSSVSGLQPNTTYHLRAWARTVYDTVYGNEMVFTTLPTSQSDNITDDRDGKNYEIIKIGNQWWFAENLNFQVANSWCYENNPAWCDTFGRLYTWNAALNSCPYGWHLPRDTEFMTLERYLGMDSLESVQEGWRGTDQAVQLREGSPIGFNITFSGFRQANGDFIEVNSSETYWSSTVYSTPEAWYRGFGIAEDNIHRYHYDKNMAFSVRCIKTGSPEIIIDSVYDITKTAVRIDANVLSDGGVTVTERGVCYKQSSVPTVNDSKISSGSGTGTFTALLPGLATNRTYYMRAYAINNYDTAYSNQVSFITLTKPVVTTAAALSVAKTTAVAGGNVTDDGGTTVTERGVCYDVLPNPVYSDSHLMIGTGTGVYSSTLSGLSPNKTYYLRAYAINSKGIAYGNEITFKTRPQYTTGIFTDSRDGKSYTKIKIGEQWWFADNLNYITTGSWCLESDVAWCDTFGRLYSYDAALNACPSHWHLPSDSEWQIMETELGMTNSYNTGWRGTDEGTQLKYEGSSGFDVLLGGFREPGGIFREITTSGTFWTSTEESAGSVWYRGFGLPETTVNREFFDKDYGFSVRCLKDTLPVVTTAAVSTVTDSSVTGGGEVIYDGGNNVTARGICIAKTTNPTIASDTTNNGTGTGQFTSYRKGLDPGTTYYARAYATNSEGTAYGSQVSFITSVTVPEVVTVSVGPVTDTSAVAAGNVTSSGGTSVTARGLCWGTNHNPTVTGNDTTINGAGTGSYSGLMKDLQPHTTYYVRAWAKNSTGTAYGNELSFTTQVGLPVVTTSSVSSVTVTTASGGGNVISEEGGSVSARGICWSSTKINPEITDASTFNGSGTGAFTSNMTGLTRYTRYYVRAYATNSAGTAYGDTISFRTLAELPAINTTAVTSVTDSSAYSGGTVTNNGGAPIISKGVCWNTTGSPTVTDDTTSDGNGTSPFTSFITGLNSSTTYYIRAYALNVAGYNYGNEIEFKTLYETDSVADVRDNQKYATVKIGNNWWMAENLNYRDTGAVYYNNDSAAWAATYGRLYTWTSMMKGSASDNTVPVTVQGVCPSGWHIPDNTEWSDLITTLGGETTAGSKLKEAGTANWKNQNTDATNESGFTAIPAGMVDAAMSSALEGTDAYFWTATESDAVNAHVIHLINTNGTATNFSQTKTNHYSVRCIKD